MSESAWHSVTQMHGVSKSAVQWSLPSSPLRRQTCRGAAAAGRLRMQEKKADVFETATVLSNAEACEGMRLLKLKVPPAIAASYIEITEANGNGYKFAEIAEDVTDVLLFATGSGIAPLKATLESGVLKGKSVTLYYGCRSEDSMPFSGLLDAWGKEWTVVPSLSQPAAQGVKDVLKEAGVPDANVLFNF